MCLVQATASPRAYNTTTNYVCEIIPGPGKAVDPFPEFQSLDGSGLSGIEFSGPLSGQFRPALDMPVSDTHIYRYVVVIDVRRGGTRAVFRTSESGTSAA